MPCPGAPGDGSDQAGRSHHAQPRPVGLGKREAAEPAPRLSHQPGVHRCGINHLAFAQQDDPPDSRGDEKGTEQVADPPSPRRRGDDQSDADADEQNAEDGDAAAVKAVHAASPCPRCTAAEPRYSARGNLSVPPSPPPRGRVSTLTRPALVPAVPRPSRGTALGGTSRFPGVPLPEPA